MPTDPLPTGGISASTPLTDPDAEVVDVAAAIRQGERRKAEISARRDMLTAPQVATRLGMSVEAVLAHRRDFEILGLSAGNGEPAGVVWTV